jgi:hypothetical protein
MEFSIKLPYRKVTLKISLDETKSYDAIIELERWARRQALAEKVAREVRDHQDHFLLLK